MHPQEREKNNHSIVAQQFQIWNEIRSFQKIDAFAKAILGTQTQGFSLLFF